MNHHFLLIIHLLSATIWVGGHLLLTFGYLPQALKEKDTSIILKYEKKYEPIGMTSLFLLIVTGIIMAYQLGVPLQSWFTFSNSIERVVSIKLLLLATTALFALSAQFRVIPKLKDNPNKLPEMAFHIISVTSLGVALLILGSFIRYGGI